MRNVPETVHAYRIPRLNWIFIFFSLLFVGSMVWMIWYDYTGYRTWKDYQREFQKLEAAKLHGDIEEEQRKAVSAGLTNILHELDQQSVLIKAHEDRINTAQATVKQRRVDFDFADNSLKFRKADLDSEKYKYDVAFEELKNHPDDSDAIERYQAEKIKLDALKAEVDGLYQEDKKKEQVVKDAETDVEKYVGERDELLKEKQKLLSKYDLAVKRVDRLTNAVVQAVLNAPFLEIAEPTIRVKQIVLENHLINVNFTEVPRVDRCISCHNGINKKDPAGKENGGPGRKALTEEELKSGQFRWTDLPEPHTAHPHLDLYVGDNSPHPMDKFGCTPCHWGWDRTMDFTRAAHTPDNNVMVKADSPRVSKADPGEVTQEEDWIRKYHWDVMEHAEQKMRPQSFIESSCLKCHSGQTSIPHADHLDYGIRLVEQAGCFNCHKMRQLETTVTHTVREGEDLSSIVRLYGSDPDQIRDANALKSDELKPGTQLVVPVRTLTRTGPSLVRISSKLDKNWVEQWLAEPRRFRPNTFMPQFWGLENTYLRLTNVDPIITYTGVTGMEFKMKDRDQVEIDAITELLFSLSDAAKYPAPPAPGDPARGKTIVENAGCFACHVVNQRLEKNAFYTDGTPVDDHQFPLLTLVGAQVPSLDLAQYGRSRSQGPMLFGTGSKMNVNWVYAWLKNPKQYHPRTKMPNLRLNDQEAADAASYLVTLRNDDFENREQDSLKLRQTGDGLYQQVRDDEVQEYLEGEYPKSEAANRVKDGRLDDKMSDFFRRVKYSEVSTLLGRWKDVLGAVEAYRGEISDNERKAQKNRMEHLIADMHGAAAPRAAAAELLNPWIDRLSSLVQTVVGWNDAEEKVRKQAVRQAGTAYDDAQKEFSRFTDSQSVALDRETKKKLYLGGKLIDRYGCFSCHEIHGYEYAKPIGTELSEWGTKLTSQLDFGYMEGKMPDNNYAYLQQKIKAPRSFDKLEVKKPQEWLKMPQFNFTPEQRKAIALVVMGMTNEKILPQARKNLSETEWQIENGRWMVKELNCVGCHIVEGKGGAIRATMDSTQRQLFPPDLAGTGTKIKPTWLYEFLKSPGDHSYRYWLSARMPTFDFHDEQINTLTRYFALLDKQTFPFEGDALETAYHPPREMTEVGEQVFEKFQCLKCHQVRPPELAAQASNIGPNLAVLKERMRPKGLVGWLANPASITPGVNMPANWPVAPEDVNPLPNVLGGDTAKQIQAVADYLLIYDGSIEAKHPLPAVQPAAAPQDGKAKPAENKNEYE